MESWLHPLVAVWPWVSYLTALSLNFHIYKKTIILLLPPEDYGEEEARCNVDTAQHQGLTQSLTYILPLNCICTIYTLVFLLWCTVMSYPDVPVIVMYCLWPQKVIRWMHGNWWPKSFVVGHHGVELGFWVKAVSLVKEEMEGPITTFSHSFSDTGMKGHSLA